MPKQIKTELNKSDTMPETKTFCSPCFAKEVQTPISLLKSATFFKQKRFDKESV